MMTDKVREYIEMEGLLQPHSRVVVGLSGGLDSMVLIHLLARLGYACVAAHCNFHLRGKESQQDTEFVKKWCSENRIPLVTVDFDTRDHAKEKGISIEMAARELRYEWFEKIRRDESADVIAVAHHQDDSVETVLLNLLRGTGIKGLTGIASRNRNVVRPLLCVSREEIEAYIQVNDLPYREDSTNREDIYTRNAIRLRIIPELEKINPKAKEAILRTSRHLAEAEKVYDHSVRQTIDSVFRNNKINIRLLQDSASPQAVLFEALSPLGFDPSTIGDIYRSMDGEPGKQFYSATHRAIKDREFILVDPLEGGEIDHGRYLIEKGTVEIFCPIHLSFRLKSVPLKIEKEKRFVYIDADKLTFPLTLRRWNKGDWFIPFGMKGKKKLSDFFVDLKFSLKEKEEAWLLVSGDRVVWVVGERGDDRFRVTENTRKVLVVELHA